MQRCESGMIYSGFSRLLKNSDSASGPGKRFRIRLKLLKHVRNCQKIPFKLSKKSKKIQPIQEKRSTGKILTIYLGFFCLDPDPKKIIPDPGKSSCSNRIRRFSTLQKCTINDTLFCPHIQRCSGWPCWRAQCAA